MPRVLTKLNTRGIAHLLVPMVVVVGAGIIGTYMLVASHAASCIGPVSPSVAATRNTCQPNNIGSTSAPPFTCSIQNVPYNAPYGSTLAPTFTIKNTSHTAGTPGQIHAVLDVQAGQRGITGYTGKVTSTQAKTYQIPTIEPGHTYSQSFGISYPVSYGTSDAASGYYMVSEPTVAGQQPTLSSCRQLFLLPFAQANCSLQGMPDTITEGNYYPLTITMKNTGSVPYNPEMYYVVNYNAGTHNGAIQLYRGPALYPGKTQVWTSKFIVGQDDPATAGKIGVSFGGTPVNWDTATQGTPPKIVACNQGKAFTIQH